MLGRDKSTAPTVDGSTLPGVKEGGTGLQRGGKVSGLCFKEEHKVIRPVQKRGDPENPNT